MSLVGQTPDRWSVKVEHDIGELLPLLGSLPVRDLEIIELRSRTCCAASIGRSVVTGALTLVRHSLRRWRAFLGATALVLVAFQSSSFSRRETSSCRDSSSCSGAAAGVHDAFEQHDGGVVRGFVLFGYSHRWFSCFWSPPRSVSGRSLRPRSTPNSWTC
jgi:hypothetical protein